MDVRLAFREALMIVWGTPGATVAFEISNDPPPADGAPAALRYDTTQARARGRTLLRCASYHTLAIAPWLLLRPAHVVRKVLLHEAIHVGYPRHDNAFEKAATEVGTASTFAAIEGRGFIVERQSRPRGRYRQVFISLVRDEAFAFAKERRAGEGAYRVVF